MRKNVIYLVFIGLVILFLAACVENGVREGFDGVEGTGGQEPMPTPTPNAVFSDSQTFLGIAAEPVVRSSTNTVEAMKVTGNSDGISPIEGPTMYRIDFQHERATPNPDNPNFTTEAWAEIRFSNSQHKDPVDISEFAGGFIVFSINYADLRPEPTHFTLGVLSTTNAGGEDGGGELNLIDLNSSNLKGDWRTYEIPLADFNTRGSLNLAKITTYFGIWNPYKDDFTMHSKGLVYLDNIYFKPAPTN